MTGRWDEDSNLLVKQGTGFAGCVNFLYESYIIRLDSLLKFPSKEAEMAGDVSFLPGKNRKKTDESPGGTVQTGPSGLCTFQLLALEFLDAVGTDVFAVEIDDIPGIIAENTGGLILFQDDGGSVYIDLQGVLFGDI